MDERAEIARDNAVHVVERAANYSKKFKAAPELLMLAYNDIEMRAWFARRY
jgi:hypothetical protein